MTWRSLTAALLAAHALGLTHCPADDKPAQQAAADAAKAAIEYVPMDAPDGMSQAVIVQGAPLVHTRQLFPVGKDGKLVGEGSVDEQIEQVLNNLEAVLKDSGSGLDKLVRLNIYALAPTTVPRVRELLSKRLDASVRPAMSPVQTPLPLRGAVVALDAVAVGADAGEAVTLKRCEAVAGDKNQADAAVMPRGGIVYLSGVPDAGSLTESAVVRAMSTLKRTMEHLKLSPKDVAHVKVFLRPVTSADEVLQQVREFFPDQAMPPVVFVEWLATVPVEIEMVARLPQGDEASEGVEFYTPPEFRPSNTFSRVALLRTDRQIYISGQYAREPSRGQPQAEFVFQQLQEILDKVGSDMRHLVKATYYVCDDDAARWVDRTRPNVFDPDRPPAASKVMVHAVGMEGRTMTIDMIAVESGK